ncbi:hypothetical protein P153DRAFT_333110 [Dothidotthia symphoricarpi CBS 119687]|uniref:D-isomer specific 2-hydroxyacid dehydrogenase NAD-binding domain-containing protein n=1 Tax=Dothidotthia symphoricarpi CBS 119687 TaxID=1392245 RepID=A0A6A6AL07_9PLEO|nr:uncharacterized protein P153DRAFT_333110 [Dothidotthia symphoricarpi CBS 119687]KAF2132652.1 hypothetical protein P153DRAFT_333110 [Dothidotthia symphoricarpi CBS 119687]
MVAMGGGPELPHPPHAAKEKELVLCVVPFPENAAKKGIEKVEEEFEDVEVRYYYSRVEKGRPVQIDIPEDLIHRATYICTLFWLPPTASSIPSIKFIQFFNAGINNVATHPIYTDSTIPLCSANGVHGPQIAEWVVMMDLLHSHGFVTYWEQQKRREWNSRYQEVVVRDRVGKRVGVLGYGSIGRQVARVAKAMGMDVLAYTASPKPTPESRKDTGFIVPGTGDPDGSFPSAWYSGTSKEALHEFLSQELDLLVIGVPLTKSTTHLLSTPEFELLHKSNPRGTYVANIARGPIIDQAALIAALEGGLIGGAALDVTDPEPLPKEDPLWTAPNCTITPHVSGNTDAYVDRAFELLRENMRRERAGGKLVNEVERGRGY